jgi:hypothetical protein
MGVGGSPGTSEAACMQIDSAVVFRRRFVILHLSLLRLVVNWRRLLREVSRILDQEEAINFSLRNVTPFPKGLDEYQAPARYRRYRAET